MKKINLVSLLVLAFTLVSCDGVPVGDTSSKGPSETAETCVACIVSAEYNEAQDYLEVEGSNLDLIWAAGTQVVEYGDPIAGTCKSVIGSGGSNVINYDGGGTPSVFTSTQWVTSPGDVGAISSLKGKCISLKSMGLNPEVQTNWVMVISN